MKKLLLFVFLTLSATLICSGCGGDETAVPSLGIETRVVETPVLPETPETPEPPLPPPAPVNLSPTEIFYNNVDSVFAIYTQTGYSYQPMGSGFFVKSTGVAITNHHVIVGAASAIAVTQDGKEFNISGYYSYDIDTDLAIIQVEGAGASFPYLVIGDDSAIRVGESVFAIGSPFGAQNTFTDGLVSRIIPLYHFRGQHDFIYSVTDVIQITAPIYGGNSGGALLNDKGQVIGVTASGCLLRDSVGVAVSISRVNLAGTENGQYLPLPIRFPAPADSPGQTTGYWSFPSVPTFGSVSLNAEFYMGISTVDFGLAQDDPIAQLYDNIFIYTLAYEHLNGFDLYENVLIEAGFVFQNRFRYIEGLALTFFYHPGESISLLFVYRWSDEIVMICIGTGNSYGPMTGNELDIAAPH